MKRREKDKIKSLSRMFILVLALLLFNVLSVVAIDVVIDENSFPDGNFKEYVKVFDLDNNGSLSPLELSKVKTIKCDNKDIANLTGIEHFTALEKLWCNKNLLGTLNVSSNTKLVYLNCADNQLTSLNVSGCDKLETLYCYDNKLDSLDLSGNPLLARLDCHNVGAAIHFPSPKDPSEKNHLTTLDLSSNTALTYLNCADNQLTSLNVSNCGSLKTLYCHENNLSGLDLSGNPLLLDLRCNDNKLETLNLSNNIALTHLRCYNSDNGNDWYPSTKDPSEKNHLTTLNLKNNVALIYINCADNQLTALDLSCNPNLKSLYCGWNKLQELEFTNNPQLKAVSCVNNELEELDFTGNPLLESLACYYNKINTLTLGNKPNLKTFYGNNNQLTTLNISDFPKLENFNCHNNKLTSLVVSNNLVLQQFQCQDNQLTSLIVSNNPALELIYCYNNNLSTLNIADTAQLKWLQCQNNNLSSLDVSSNPALRWLMCGDNQLTSLNVGGNTNLFRLFCENNQLTSLDVSGNGALTRLYYHGNQLTAFDLSNNNNISQDSSDDGDSKQVYRTALASVSANGMYQFDLSQVQGINLAKVNMVKQENGADLPATASYDNTNGLLEFNPAEKVFKVRYYHHLNHQIHPERNLEVIVSLAYLYNVTYKNEWGNVIGTPQIVAHGSNAIPESLPYKEGHTGSWSHNGVNITSDIVIYPIYTVIGYVVRYQDEDGNPIGSPQVVDYGCDATPEAIPYKEGYTGKWDHDGRNVMQHLTIKPIYEIKQFNVVYKNDRGETVGTPQTVNYGQDATPERFPEKEGYTGEWSHDGKNIKANTVIQPLYTIKKYTVTYQDEHGKTIGLPQTVNHGSNASPERVPKKEGYVGEWSLNGRNIVADTVIKPLYTIKTYTVTYQDERDNIIGIPQTVDHGSDVRQPEVVPPKTGYTGSWNHDGRNITADIIIKPVYTIRTYIVTYHDEDDEMIGKPQTVAYGANAIPEPIPVKEGFVGSWNHDGKNITADTQIKLIYKCEGCPDCIVTYQDENGNIIGTPQEVSPGSDAVPEDVPEKSGYTGKWNHDGKNITANTTIKPVYAADKIEPSVRTPTFMTKIGDGKELLVSIAIVFLWIILLLLLTRRKEEEEKEEVQSNIY